MKEEECVCERGKEWKSIFPDLVIVRHQNTHVTGNAFANAATWPGPTAGEPSVPTNTSKHMNANYLS